MNYRLDFGFPYDDYNHFKSNEYGSNNNDIQNINDSFMSEPDYTNMDVYHLFSFEERNIELLNENEEFNNQLQNPSIKNNLGKNLTFYGNQKTTMIVKKTKRTNNLNVEKKLNMGRKPKNSLKKGKHTKYFEDNIMRKIKAYYLKYAHNLINKNIKNKYLKLFKLDSEISENLKKDFNITLMNTTFRGLYEDYPLSSKYRRKAKDISDLNKHIIKRIYSEYREKEIDAINILNKTYKELFNHFIRNNLDAFLNDIYEKEKEKNEPEDVIVNYVKKIEYLCNNYEQYFMDIKGRNRKQKQTNLIILIE